MCMCYELIRIYMRICNMCVYVFAMCLYIHIVTWYKIFIPRREFIFRTCEDGAAWHLIPRKISSS